MEEDNVTSLIRCTICFDLKRGYIYQCDNGHIVCNECKPKVEINCPTGRCGTIRSRNIIAEKLRNRSNLEFPCQNEDEGCEITERISQLEIHESECLFRTIKCSFERCEENLLALEFDDHVAESHIACDNATEGCDFDGSVVQNEEHQSECPYRIVPCPERYCKDIITEKEVVQHVKSHHEPNEDYFKLQLVHKYILLRKDLKGESWMLRLASYREDLFLVQFEKSADKTYFAWLSIVGSSTQADKYSVIIKAEGNGCELEMRNRRVYPIDIKVQDVMKEENCFRMSEDLVKLFRKENLDEEDRKKEGYSHKLHVSYQLFYNA